DLASVTAQLSDLADAFVAQSLSVVSTGLGRAGLIVLALGKWGGRELNYSSDIDLIFLSSRASDTPEATQLARRLIRALSEPTSGCALMEGKAPSSARPGFSRTTCARRRSRRSAR